MKNDIRLQTVLIIKKDNYYLVDRNITGNIIWRQDYSDAWRTRVRAAARSIAEKTGGEIYLFNPVVCQLRKYVG
jgi:hypothetical protein